MGMVLNSLGQLRLFEGRYKGKYFVDKSLILEKLNESIGLTDQQYICITRPRRFGKTIMTNLISSYYAKGLDSGRVFDTLKIAEKEDYKIHLNQHNVISLYMSELPENCKSYEDYISFHSKKIKNDLIKSFPDCDICQEDALWTSLGRIFNETGECFIFILDEWDSIFHQKSFTEQDCMEYLGFLRNLLKDRPYVELAYMTGILPIKKYSSGSDINMFKEYYFPKDKIYDTYFGFTEDEVKELCQRNEKYGGSISYEQLEEWYNGYYTYEGKKLYNPRSVNFALTENNLQDYWTKTGPGNEILDLVQKNVDAVRDDIVRMVAGEKIYFSQDDFVAHVNCIKNKEEIYSAMVIYGFLSYYDSNLSIPNRELMLKFQRILKNQSMGYIAQLAQNSQAMLEATLAKDTDKMAEILEYTHNTEIPILRYNDENSLSCVITLIYLSARERYRVEREDKSGRGYVDFIFYPLRAEEPGIILELKKDKSPEDAIEQIKEKKYATRFQKLENGIMVSTCKLLLVGINYDTKSGKHSCRVEEGA